MKLTPIAIFAALTLSACGTGSLSTSGCTAGNAPEDCMRVEPVPDLRARLNAYTATIDRLTPIPNTAFSQVPTTGRAAFNGVGLVAIEPTFILDRNGQPQVLDIGDPVVGDANLTVDFGGNTITGDVTNLIGSVNTNAVQAYAGSVQITGGTIGVARPNALTADYTVNITGNGAEITATGTLQGALQGARPIKGLRLVDLNRETTLNGRQRDAFIVIGAEPN